MEGLVQGWSSERDCDGRAAGDGDSNIDLANVLPRLLCLLTSCIYYVLRNRDKLPPYSSSYSSLLPARLALTGPIPRFIWLFISRCWFSLPVTRFQLLLRGPPCPLSLKCTSSYGKSMRNTVRATIITVCQRICFWFIQKSRKVDGSEEVRLTFVQRRG